MKVTSETPSLSRWTLPALLFLLVLHVALAVSYARVTPYRVGGIVIFQGRSPAPDIGAPDERQHANYVQHLLDGKGIPVFNPSDPNLIESYQSHQPPLYYLVAAGYSRLLGLTDLSQSSQGVPLRYLNALISAATLLGVYFLCIWGFGRPDVGLLAAVIAGLMPMFVAVSGAVSNDPLLFMICTWTLALCALGVRQGWTVRRCVAAGVLIGLGILTKTTAVALIPTLLVAFWISPERPNLKLFAAAAVPALLLAVPWWVRNVQVLHGFDPLAMNAFTQAFTGSAQAKDFIGVLGPYGYWVDMVGWWTARSFVGAFGYMDIFLDKTTYRLIFVTIVVLIGGWVLASQKPEWKEHRRVQIVNLVFLGLILILFLRFNAQYFQGQARYLYPAVAVVGSGFAIGAAYLFRNRVAVAGAVLGAGLLALNLYILGMLPAEFMKRIVG